MVKARQFSEFKYMNSTLICLWLIIFLFASNTNSADAAGPRKDPVEKCSRYSLPKTISEKPFQFADEYIPVQRRDVHSRILFQVNFLLLDARSVLTDWLSEKSRTMWLLEDLLVKEGIPKDFVWLAPILAGANLKTQSRQAGAGWWALEKNCDSSDGIETSEDAWHDDRLDIELSTRCFAGKIKKIRKELGDVGWLMAAAAYISGQTTVQDMMKRWNGRDFWDIPMPDAAEELITRWIALKIISSNREHFGLKFSESSPLVFDQVTGIILTKDLPVGELAAMVGIASREILELNPKLKPSSGILPAQNKGSAYMHSISVPKGKGSILLEKLKSKGYIDGSKS